MHTFRRGGSDLGDAGEVADLDVAVAGLDHPLIAERMPGTATNDSPAPRECDQVGVGQGPVVGSPERAGEPVEMLLGRSAHTEFDGQLGDILPH